jgi:hypothetical protein
MNWFTRIRTELLGYRIDPDLLNAYRTAIPSTINLDIEHSRNHYVATVKSIENEELPNKTLLVTEANTTDELVKMVNDLILTYKKIPIVYRPYYREILQPEGSVARAENLTLVKAS